MEIIVNGESILYSPEDQILIDNYRWFLSGGRYAECWYKGKSYYLHRLLMNPPKGMVVDHINGNSFDNRRENLRIVTQSVNLINMKDQRNISGYRGIYIDKRPRKSPFRVEISRNKKKVFVKSFQTMDEAIIARDKFLESYDIV